ncbi:TIGR04283 family arsenosugar biosynthesis glycosyltransferase [Radiobacillus kanasensis]|uniref:TIGR04283 family arsenosugar biosynthesis glycosyltransferase n=1 Tax=Radiobacillus kanasensis TaxID=2844358 RepID=UPI001E4431F5|nr:TIGR04283 family arsenosugar biosynthesis glycosyltransferase [Radiobacillus kanasensis]UFT98640.1 TIGR04283 family arsenosugar biosynthesis glycosyltransferase [Radiobacillus kanasensis]
MGSRISIIIPTWNEEDHILPLLDVLSQLSDIEIIIADGGSEDRTCSIAEKYGQVISCERGRACQMNSGANQAKGEILWFLHADSLVTSNLDDSIRTAMEDPSVIGGGFSMYFDDSSFMLDLIARGSNFRAKYFHLYFGDQGFFIRRSVFEEVGGFPLVSLMEDWMLSRITRNKGKLKLLSDPIVTSSRRFRKNGILPTFLLMQKIKILFILGVPTAKLERMYRRG